MLPRFLCFTFPSYVSNTQHVQRHPFARLFSAWNQKFKRNNDRWRDFIDVKIEHFETVNNRSGSSHLNSFDAFLKHIAATKRSKDFNVHWSSIYRSCRPCSIDYRALIKKVLLHMVSDSNVSVFLTEKKCQRFSTTGSAELKLFRTTFHKF